MIRQPFKNRIIVIVGTANLAAANQCFEDVYGGPDDYIPGKLNASGIDANPITHYCATIGLTDDDYTDLTTRLSGVDCVVETWDESIDPAGHFKVLEGLGLKVVRPDYSGEVE